MKQIGLIVVLLGLYARSVTAQAEEGLRLSNASFKDGYRLVEIAKNWKFQAGDDRAWADPEFDDSAWEKAKDTRLKAGEWGGIGWFRLHLEVEPELWESPLALLYHQTGAAEIYVDGRLLYTFGTVGASGTTEEQIHTNDLKPLRLLLGGRSHHVIAVRYSNFHSALYRHLGLDPGFYAHLGKWNEYVQNLQRKHARYQMFFTGVPLAFGLLHLLLFLFYLRARENLYYAVHTAAIAATTFFVFNVQISSTEELFLFSRMARIAIVAADISGLLFVYILFYARLPKLFWGFLSGGSILGIWSLWASIDYVYLFTLISQVELLRVVVVALYRRKDGAWIIGMGLMTYVFAVGYQMLMLFEIVGFLGPLSYVYVYGVLGMLVSMSVYLARNFGRTSHGLEKQLEQVRELSSQLEKKVEERTRELSAKNTELEDTLGQLQETQNQLIMQEKMASLGNLVAGVAHEINTPIGAVKSASDVSARCIVKIVEAVDSGASLEVIRASRPFQQAVKLLGDNNQVTVTASERIAGIVRSLRTFARLDEAELLEADLHEGLDSTLTLVQHELKNKVNVIRKYGDVPRIYCFPNQLN